MIINNKFTPEQVSSIKNFNSTNSLNTNSISPNNNEPKLAKSITSPIMFTSNFYKSDDSIGVRVDRVKSQMKNENLDALIVASTDDYLSEDVDSSQSQREYLTGFSGSEGDAIIMPEKSALIVDGRYHLQADQQVDSKIYKVEKMGLDENGERIEELPEDRKVKVLNDFAEKTPDKKIRVGYDASKISTSDFQSLQGRLVDNIELVPTVDNLVDKTWQNKSSKPIKQIRKVPTSLTGETCSDRLNRARNLVKKSGADMIVLTDLSDVAYLTNLRGKDMDANATFQSKMLLTPTKAVLFCNPEKVPQSIKKEYKGLVEFQSEDKFGETTQQIIKASSANGENKKLAVSLDTTNYDTYQDLKKATGENVELVELDSNPIAEMRAIKNPTQMDVYKKDIKRTDVAITGVMKWLNKGIQQGDTITEKDLENKMLAAHLKNGANDLSFATIPAAGENSAIIHYEKGDPNKIIKAGDLVLVDTGAYYEAGMATDLTRTWIAGGKAATPTGKQKAIYTTVVKGALHGLYAELPPGAIESDLDAKVRNPIKEKGYDYMHSTGHGVGVVVHECPPYISSSKRANKEITEGTVFSIEPGVYLEGWGGVRFENLVTVVPHSDPKKALNGWHQVECLSHAPIDNSLIDIEQLSPKERGWLADFNKKSNNLINNTPKEALEV